MLSCHPLSSYIFSTTLLKNIFISEQQLNSYKNNPIREYYSQHFIQGTNKFISLASTIFCADFYSE